MHVIDGIRNKLLIRSIPFLGCY